MPAGSWPLGLVLVVAFWLVAYWFVAFWIVTYWFVAYWFVTYWFVAYWFAAYKLMECWYMRAPSRFQQVGFQTFQKLTRQTCFFYTLKNTGSQLQRNRFSTILNSRSSKNNCSQICPKLIWPILILCTLSFVFFLNLTRAIWIYKFAEILDSRIPKTRPL